MSTEKLKRRKINLDNIEGNTDSKKNKLNKKKENVRGKVKRKR